MDENSWLIGNSPVLSHFCKHFNALRTEKETKLSGLFIPEQTTTTSWRKYRSDFGLGAVAAMFHTIEVNEYRLQIENYI